MNPTVIHQPLLVSRRFSLATGGSSFNAVQDERVGRVSANGCCPDSRTLYYVIPSPTYVIPSVAEESGMPALDSISGFLDSSATLGMTG